LVCLSYTAQLLSSPAGRVDRSIPVVTGMRHSLRCSAGVSPSSRRRSATDRHLLVAQKRFTLVHIAVVVRPSSRRTAGPGSFRVVLVEEVAGLSPSSRRAARRSPLIGGGSRKQAGLSPSSRRAAWRPPFGLVVVSVVGGSAPVLAELHGGLLSGWWWFRWLAVQPQFSPSNCTSAPSSGRGEVGWFSPSSRRAAWRPPFGSWWAGVLGHQPQFSPSCTAGLLRAGWVVERSAGSAQVLAVEVHPVLLRCMVNGFDAGQGLSTESGARADHLRDGGGRDEPCRHSIAPDV
jgi:hypothetical protein